MADDPPGVFSILMVCTANICRSPMAEHLLREALRTASMRVDVRSAGVRGWEGAEMDPAAAAELRRLGGDPTGFLARNLIDAYSEAADLILTATLEHRVAVLEAVPSALRRTFTLREFAHLVTEVEAVRAETGSPRDLVRRAAAARGAARMSDYAVPDPYGGSASTHRRTAEIIQSAVAASAEAIVAASAEGVAESRHHIGDPPPPDKP